MVVVTKVMHSLIITFRLELLTELEFSLGAARSRAARLTWSVS